MSHLIDSWEFIEKDRKRLSRRQKLLENFRLDHHGYPTFRDPILRKAMKEDINTHFIDCKFGFKHTIDYGCEFNRDNKGRFT